MIDFLRIIWVVLLSVGFLYWITTAILCVVAVKNVTRLENAKPQEPSRWPRLSLVITACNEEGTLEIATRSRLEDDYPDLEMILVDDRSTDGTSEIIDRIAKSDPRVKAVHIRELPDGWLGKVHALDLGLRETTGEWVLFTDADVHFDRGVMKKAIAWAMERNLDHLGIFPSLWSRGFWINTIFAVFVRTFAMSGKYYAMNNPKVEKFTGVGAFNLVRKSAFETTPGFEWLKLEIGDDAGLGIMMQRWGKRSSLLNGAVNTRVQWYTRIRGMARGMDRATFAAIGNYNGALLAYIGALGLFCELAPILAMLSVGMPLLQWMGLVAFILSEISSVVMTVWARGPILPSLFYPFGSALLFGMFFRAAWVGSRRGGVEWRGTFYPSRVMRGGRRIGMP